MVAQQRQHNSCSSEEYLARERLAAFKSEYLDGDVYAMAGGSPEHNTISVNVSGELRARLKGTPCQVFSSDMKVQTNPSGLCSYPDVTVVRGEPIFGDDHKDVLVNPAVLFEVLSPSTEAFDRGAKFERYQQITSLTNYVLINQNKARAEHFARQAPNKWLLESVAGSEAALFLPSLGVSVPLAEVYECVTFPTPLHGAEGIMGG